VLGLVVEPLLPGRLLPSRLAQKRRERADPEQALVQPMPRLFERTCKIHKQNHAVTVGVVPNLVIEGVVEDQCSAPPILWVPGSPGVTLLEPEMRQ